MAEQGLVLKIELDGKEHIFRYNECSALDYVACREQTGVPLTRLLGMIEDGETDIDSIAAAVWIARRQAGERKLKFMRVAESIHPTTPCTITIITEETDKSEETGGDADPE